MKMIDKAPVICLWGILKENTNFFELLGMNNKAKGIFNVNSVIGKDILNILGVKDKINSHLIYEKMQNNIEFTLEEYIPILNRFYEIEIVNICDNLFAVFLTKCNYYSEILEFISDNIPDHIFFKDTNGIFRHCNENFAKAHKCTKEEIIGKSEDEIARTINNCQIRYKKEDAKVCSTKRKIISEGVEVLQDGSKVYTETIKAPFIYENGIVGGVLGICRDISHRKEAEVEFERLRTEFFANLSHEFRTPLNLIFSSIQLLDVKLEQYKDDGEKNYNIKGYEKYINIIRQNGYRLLKLVNNLIDSTRLDVGSLEYNPRNCDIVNYVENIFDSVVEFANQNSINMIFDTAIEEHVVAFDLDKMERIILNLISNAIKFNKKNGLIEVSINCNEKFVEIEVKDTGIGIPSEKLGEVFEKFKQVNNRMTKVSEGSGIGLSLVKSLVDLHNGKIEVESELGEYTKFTVKIPNVLIKEDAYINYENYSSKYIENMQVEFSDIYLKLNT